MMVLTRGQKVIETRVGGDGKSVALARTQTDYVTYEVFTVDGVAQEMCGRYFGEDEVAARADYKTRELA